mmetsp:Transcript_36924/g.73053  ORF Transcript_36924/g.73053 Transcript_36924/m.73053 type:complete len:193 (+) Transcript_36924:82-660(+)
MGGGFSSEAAKIVEGLGAQLTAEDAEKLWKEVDKNNDGKMDKEETKRLYTVIKKKSIKELEAKLAALKAGKDDDAQVDALFCKFDQNKNGEVTKEEFIHYATFVGYNIDLSDIGKDEDGERPAKRAKTDTDEKGDFKVGDKIQIEGVTTAAGKVFNGQTAEVLKWNEHYGKWVIRLSKAPVTSIPLENMKRV